MRGVCSALVAAICLKSTILTESLKPGIRRVVELWPPKEPLNRSTRWPQFGLDPSNFTITRSSKGSKPVGWTPLVLGVSLDTHDCSLSVVRQGGEILAAVELERLHKQRYFSLMHSGADTIDGAMEATVVPALAHLCMIVTQTSSPCRLRYRTAVVAWGIFDRFSVKLQKLVHADEWVFVDHHHAHAAYGWLSSPFYHQDPSPNVTVVLSYDGAGNDGTLRMFTGQAASPALTPLGHPRRLHSFGYAYDVAASFVRDLAWGSPYGSKPPCPQSSKNQFACTQALPGSFMAFAAIGRFRDEWRRGAELFFKRGLWHQELWPSPYGGFCDLVDVGVRGGPPHTPGSNNHYFNCSGTDEEKSRQLDRDFAATAQGVFQTVILDEVRRKIALLHDGQTMATSLVIVGGCALNVKTNSAIARGLNLPSHVPSAPGDNGLAIGAAWLRAPPRFRSRTVWMQQSQLHFVGSPLLQPLLGKGTPVLGLATPEVLAEAASRWGATKLQTVGQLADLLLGGAIIGVARGHAEFGPRALGHRSLLAAAHRAEQKDRLNRLKNRRWYRPCAPIVAAEDLRLMFEPGPDLFLGSPYMSFAPPLRAWVKDWLPAVAHIDNTARPQGVEASHDPWMHALLVTMRQAMAERVLHDPANGSKRNCLDESGKELPNNADCIPPPVGVLINTSLNPKGKPIAADYEDALSMFCEATGDELDFILLGEEWLFKRSTALSLGLCTGTPVEKHAPSGLGADMGAFPDDLPPI